MLSWRCSEASLSAAACPPLPRAAQNEGGKQSEQPLYYEVESLNEALPALDKPPDLSTPRAALVNFFLASRDGNFDRAARSLNFQAIPGKKRSPDRSAMQLYYIMSQHIDVDFKKVPDRPNAAIEEASDEPDSHPRAGQPRRSIKIGEVPLTLGDVEIRLERFKPHNGEPVWLFSPRTVEKIVDMYERHGPGPLFELLPFRVRHGLLTGSSGWQWLVLLAISSLAWLSGLLCQKLAWVLSSRLAPEGIREEATRMATPIGALIGLLAFYVVTYVLLAPPGDDVRALYVLISILIVAGLTWIGIRLIDLFSALAIRKCHVEIGSYAEEEARARYTRISLARHLLIFLAICIGLGLALYELQVIKNLSLSFLASAGVAGVILGATAHTVLGNTLAGVQIAMTQPVTIGDSVNFEGQWGFVEAITYAYIAIRTWDGRRVIVPGSYFITHPFENWSKSDTRILKPIFLYADYHVDVETVRKEFRELLEHSDNWDRTVEPVLQVTGMSEKTIELRALCSAKDPGIAWDLHCDLRERLVTFLQTMEGGRYFTKQRVELSNHAGGEEGTSRSGVSRAMNRPYGRDFHAG